MEDIVARLKELGGLHEADDFDAQRCEYVDPIHARFAITKYTSAHRTGRGSAH